MAYNTGMESISRNVGDLTATERQVYETVLGHQLHAGQRVIVQLIDVDARNANEGDSDKTRSKTAQSKTASQENGKQHPDSAQLPEWCDVYRGLSDKEVEEVEESILARSPASRGIDIEF